MRRIAGGLVLSLLLPITPVLALTLDEAVTAAKTGNPGLSAVRQTQNIALAGVEAAQSGYLPRVDVRAGMTAMPDPQAILTLSGAQPTGEDRYAFFNLRLDQTLYDFGRTVARIDRARAGQNQVVADIDDLSASLVYATIQAYYLVLDSSSQISSAAETVKSIEDHRRVAQALFDEGVVTRNDLLQADVRLAAAKQSLLDWENRRENAWIRLNRLIGAPLDSRPQLEDWPPGAVTACADEADLQNRPDLRAAHSRLSAAEAAVREGRSAFFPRIFAAAEINTVENRYVREQTLYSATIGLEANLFAGFSTRAALQQDLARQRQALENLADIELQAQAEYQVALNDDAVAAAKMTVLETAISRAEENLRINRERYREQVGTATEVLDAQTLLSQSRSDYAHARYERSVAAARILKALGKL